jgi:hypothetical protein
MSRLISNKHIHKDKQTKTNKHFNSTITQAAYLSFFFLFFFVFVAELFYLSKTTTTTITKNL